jgi:hypothetical protein
MILLKKDKKQAGKKIKINLNKNYKKWNRLARIRIKKWNIKIWIGGIRFISIFKNVLRILEILNKFLIVSR